jgi:hypothetical protein
MKALVARQSLSMSCQSCPWLVVLWRAVSSRKGGVPAKAQRLLISLRSSYSLDAKGVILMQSMGISFSLKLYPSGGVEAKAPPVPIVTNRGFVRMLHVGACRTNCLRSPTQLHLLPRLIYLSCWALGCGSHKSFPLWTDYCTLTESLRISALHKLAVVKTRRIVSKRESSRV